MSCKAKGDVNFSVLPLQIFHSHLIKYLYINMHHVFFFCKLLLGQIKKSWLSGSQFLYYFKINVNLFLTKKEGNCYCAQTPLEARLMQQNFNSVIILSFLSASLWKQVIVRESCIWSFLNQGWKTGNAGCGGGGNDEGSSACFCSSPVLDCVMKRLVRCAHHHWRTHRTTTQHQGISVWLWSWLKHSSRGLTAAPCPQGPQIDRDWQQNDGLIGVMRLKWAVWWEFNQRCCRRAACLFLA